MRMQTPAPRVIEIPPVPALPGGSPGVVTPEVAAQILQAQIASVDRTIAALREELAAADGSRKQKILRDEIQTNNRRLRELDGQLNQLLTGNLTFTGTADSERGIPRDVVGIIESAMLTACVIALGVPLIRLFARRWDRKAQSEGTVTPEIASRFDRIEQAVDAIAVEVERISEGQRYTTRLMSEMRGLPAPGLAEGEVSKRDRIEVPR